MGKTRVEVRLREDEFSFVEHIRQVYGFDKPQQAIRLIIRKYKKINEALRRSKTLRKTLSRVLNEMDEDEELEVVNI